MEAISEDEIIPSFESSTMSINTMPPPFDESNEIHPSFGENIGRHSPSNDYLARDQPSDVNNMGGSPTDETADSLELLLRCVICQQTLKHPKILPCHHSCCLGCLEGQASGEENLCPECILTYRIPQGGPNELPDDSKAIALLYFRDTVKPSKEVDNTNPLSHSQVTNRVSEVIEELHLLRGRVNDFNSCENLWHKVVQSNDSVVLMTEKGRPLENVAGVLRMRRQQLHDRLDAFLKEETQSVYERAEYEIVRATEYSSYVESKLAKQDKLSEDNIIHMKGQCAVMSHQIDKLMSKLTDQIVSMPLKIVRAVDDENGSLKGNSIYGVDVGTQVSLGNHTGFNRGDMSREVSFAERQNSFLRERSFQRSRPSLRERSFTDRSNISNRAPVTRERSFIERQNSSESFVRGRDYLKNSPTSRTFTRSKSDESHKKIPGLILRTTIMQPSNRVIQTNYCRSLHRVKAFGRNWFGGRGSRLGPAGVMVTSDGILAVTDGTNRCLRLCTLSGLSVDSYLGYNAILQLFRDPQGVCEDKSRRLMYITDKEQACVIKFDLETGDILDTIDVDGRPVGAACDSNGNLFVCDEERHCISVHHNNGSFIGNIGSGGRAAGEFNRPHSVAIAPDSRIWVSDTNNNRLQVLSPTGQFVKFVGSKGSGLGQLKSPKGLAIDYRGWVHVADYGNRRVQVFDSNGKPAVVFGKEETNLHWEGGPVGIAITRSKNKSDQERIFVSYRGDHRIAVFMIQYDE